MEELLKQLGLDQTYFIELGLIALIVFALSQVYFKPFLVLIQARHRRTIEDREAAEQLARQAELKLAEYQKALIEERIRIKKQLEVTLAEAKKQEEQLLSEARAESKKLTQEAVDMIQKQREGLKQQVAADIEQFAHGISERLLSRNVR